MTAKAGIKQSDLNRMAMAAKKHGVAIEAEINGVIYRVLPHAEPKQEKTIPHQELNSLEAWRNRHRTDHQHGQPLSSGVSGSGSKKSHWDRKREEQLALYGAGASVVLRAEFGLRCRGYAVAFPHRTDFGRAQASM